MEEHIRFSCPACGKQLKAKPEIAGRKTRCPCGEVFSIPGGRVLSRQAPAAPGGEGRERTKPRDADWEELVAYLSQKRPADIDIRQDSTVIENQLRYLEARASDSACPRFTYYVLRATIPAETAPYLIVVTGQQSEHDESWNFNYAPIRERTLPGKTWTDIVGSGAGCLSNHSKPGCTLASTAPFDKLANAILERRYELICVIRPSEAENAAPKKAYRWEVVVSGEEAVRPELACHICGENRVSLGYNGSHLKCLRCGAIYCRRNCQASIHGQCPRCGEADRIDDISELPKATATELVTSSSERPVFNMEATVAELVELVGGTGGFSNRQERIREIGETLAREGGIELMQKAYYRVRGSGRYFSQSIWDGIGGWLS